MTRPVIIYKYEKPDGAAYDTPYKKIEIGKGKFHKFGASYEEFEQGEGNFPAALVEMADGSMLNISVELIKFDDRVNVTK